MARKVSKRFPITKCINLKRTLFKCLERENLGWRYSNKN